MPQSDSSQYESLDEELVAYLDGQLDPESARQIEQRMASEETVRRRLQQLAQSWDMLDQLPHAVADDGFMHSTVQMVAVAAEQELAEQQAVEPRRQRRRWLLAAALGLLAGSCGFVVAALLWSDPNERLLRDLSTIENVEAYRQVGDIEFLHKLNEEGMFSDDAPDPTAAKTAPGAAEPDESRTAKEPPPSSKLDTLEQRREYLAKMSPKDMEELRSKFEMFEALSPVDQDKLRKFDSQLNSDPNEDRLRRVMGRFSDWLKTLLTYERAELLNKRSSDRIQQIRSLRHGLEAKMAALTGASKPDVAAIHDWMKAFAKDHENELLKEVRPGSWIQEELSTAMGQRRTQLLTLVALQHWRRTGEAGQSFTASDQELEKLKAKLSQAALKDLPADPDKQLEAIKQLVKTVAQANWFNRPTRTRPKVSVEELHKFYQELPPKEKDALLGLPGEELDRELRIKYFQKKYGRGPGQRDGSPAGDNPGGRENRGSRERARGGPRPETGPNIPNPPATKEADPPTKPDGASLTTATPDRAASK